MKGHWNGYSWHPDEKSDVREFVSDREAREHLEPDEPDKDPS